MKKHSFPIGFIAEVANYKGTNPIKDFKDVLNRQRKSFGEQWNYIDEHGNLNIKTLHKNTAKKLPDTTVLLMLYADWQERQKEQAQAEALNEVRDIKKVRTLAEDLKLQRDDFYPIYNEIKDQEPVNLLRYEDRVELAQKIAVFKRSFELYQFDKDRESHVTAIKQTFPDIKITVGSFSNLIAAISKNGYIDALLDKRKVTKVQPRISSFQLARLQNDFINPKKLSCPKMHSMLCKAVAELNDTKEPEEVKETPISLSTVKWYVRNVFEKNIELYALRYGKDAAKKKLPYVTRERAQHRNTLIGFDGWTLPFWVKDERGSYKRYVLFFTMDSHSKYIIEYGVAKSENTVLILAVLENTVRKIGGLPTEFVSDNHSFHTTKISAHLKYEVERRGGKVVTTMNPQANHTERNNQYLHEIAQDLPGWVSSINDRLSEEYYREAGRTVNQYTVDEVKATATHIVNTYNERPQNVLNGQSPKAVYEQSTDAKLIRVNEEEIAQIFGQRQEHKIIAGQITIKRGIQKYEYQVSAETYDQYNDRHVMVSYADLREGVYLFDLKTDEFIEYVPHKLKVPAAAADRLPEHVELLNKITGRKNGIVSKGSKANEKRLLQALKDNPNNAHLLASVPKGIRQIANEYAELNRELKVQGMNSDRLPDRKPAMPTERPIVNIGKNVKHEVKRWTPPSYNNTEE